MGVAYVYSGLVVALEAADLDVLTDGQNLLLQSSLNGNVAHHASLQSVNVSRSFLHNNGCQIGYKCLEISILCNEVGLGVNLDDCAYAALIAYLRADNTLCCDTASLLGSLCQTLLTQDLNCLLKITVSFLQCLLAVHHTNIGLLTQGLYVLSGKCHCSVPPRFFSKDVQSQ